MHVHCQFSIVSKQVIHFPKDSKHEYFLYLFSPDTQNTKYTDYGIFFGLVSKLILNSQHFYFSHHFSWTS